ncbi:aminopeptidase [Paenibacillus hodogayensis]|uniref:Aminopeptidase n=1 Tax=Paenibacillus hodogayensis TaxID=279208 RepID=A0ABV5VUR9_9BACL
MLTFQQKLDRYAELIVKVGANVQQGQTLMLQASVDSAELARRVVQKAYEAGAYTVKVRWSDDEASRIAYDLASAESFLEEPTWTAAEKIELAKNGAAFVTITSADPDLLKGVSAEKIKNANKTTRQALAPYSELSRAFKISWSLATAPSKAWAAKVFPDVPEEEQIGKLWDAIFRMVRADQDDPLALWEQHIVQLKRRAGYLNDKQYAKLHYVGPGTDLTIGLPKRHIWLGGSKQNEQGTWFVPNLPTEEVYTAPAKTEVNGTVSSTKPLSYSGNIIDRFSFTFENGRVVKATAAEGEETLLGLLETDEGAKYLGEVALVPHRSPISDSGLLFYKTLFDENASCHLAVGSAYTACVEGGVDMTAQQLAESGLNASMAHTDFMIGSGELDIYGITEDGSREAVFVKGNWAFE